MDLLGACSTDTSWRDEMKLDFSDEEGGEFLLKIKPVHHRKNNGGPVFNVHHVAVLHYFASVITVLVQLFSLFTGPTSPGPSPCGGPHFHGVLVDHNFFAAEALRVSASRPAKGHQPRKRRTKIASFSSSADAGDRLLDGPSRSLSPASTVLTKNSFAKVESSGGFGGRGKGGRTSRSAGSWNEDKPRAGAPSFAQETEEQLRVGHGKGIEINCEG